MVISTDRHKQITRTLLKKQAEMKMQNMPNLMQNRTTPLSDNYTDRNQHQQSRSTPPFIQSEQLPIWLKLDEILQELKKLNAK